MITETKPIHINSLAVAEPHPVHAGFSFDATREVSDTMRAALDHNFRVMMSDAEKTHAYFAADDRVIYYHLLAPEAFRPDDISEWWEGAKREIDDSSSVTTLIGALSVMRTIDPVRTQAEISLSSEQKSIVEEKMALRLDSPAAKFRITSLLRNLRIISSQLIPVPSFDSVELENLATSIRTDIDGREFDLAVIQMIVDLRIFDEEAYQKVIQGTDYVEKAVEYLSGYFYGDDEFRANDIEIVGPLMILGAGRVEVTSNGIQLVNAHNPTDTKSAPIPVSKKFPVI